MGPIFGNIRFYQLFLIARPAGDSSSGNLRKLRLVKYLPGKDQQDGNYIFFYASNLLPGSKQQYPGALMIDRNVNSPVSTVGVNSWFQCFPRRTACNFAWLNTRTLPFLRYKQNRIHRLTSCGFSPTKVFNDGKSFKLIKTAFICKRCYY